MRQVHSLGEQAICSREQASERKRLLISKSDTTAQCDCPDERYPHRVPDLPFPLNSTLKSAPGSGPEREEVQSVGRESTLESSLQYYLQGRTPHLRDQARLSDTWLTDRSFGKQLGRDFRPYMYICLINQVSERAAVVECKPDIFFFYLLTLRPRKRGFISLPHHVSHTCSSVQMKCNKIKVG